MKVLLHPAPPSKRVLYIQYTNPAAYPPLEHSARLLARRGWQVEFYGLRGQGGTVLEFAPHLRVHVRRLRACSPGIWQKLHYMLYSLLCLWRAFLTRPDWVYASDPFSSPVALLIRRLVGSKVIYHEHDSPTPSHQQDRFFAKYIAQQRGKIAHLAELVIVPNQQRLAALIEETAPRGKTFCVWNTPLVEEVLVGRLPHDRTSPLRVIYHGSIVPDRFPVTFLQALVAVGSGIKLRLVGYEPAGHIGYISQLYDEAQRLGVADQFEYLGAMSHFEILAASIDCEVGLAMLRINQGDINMQHMTGASNKPFDYLSQGLAIIVSPDAEWQTLFASRGCARVCSLEDVTALRETFRWLCDHREEVHAMGQRGREMILSEWNYDTQFAPAILVMES